MLVLSHSATHYLNGYMAYWGCHEMRDQSRSPRGHRVWCGCHEILIESLLKTKKVFYRDPKKCQLNPNFLSGWQEKRWEMTVGHEFETQKNELWWEKWFGGTKCWSPVVKLSCSCWISLICRQLPLKFLCSSVRRLTLVIVASTFKIEEFLHKMAISCSELKCWTE